ncbi:hypothetical protein T12_15887 [Trichinella patagoniensis]|uniref:Uncharacterized protein n=1 Tax=Trichinella patagoniensis TaxID=990121 RepID=A0A0V0Z807_9BILA|nr:hypothetical protein T12_15887 [Trichinella patagoniensis]
MGTDECNSWCACYQHPALDPSSHAEVRRLIAILQVFNKPGRARRISTADAPPCRVHHADVSVFTAGRPTKR